MKFLIPSALSSALLLYGMVMGVRLCRQYETWAKIVRAASGEIDLSTGAEPLGGSYALLLGIVSSSVAGFGFKISTVPFQMWVPDVYEGARLRR